MVVGSLAEEGASGNLHPSSPFSRLHPTICLLDPFPFVFCHGHPRCILLGMHTPLAWFDMDLTFPFQLGPVPIRSLTVMRRLPFAPVSRSGIGGTVWVSWTDQSTKKREIQSTKKKRDPKHAAQHGHGGRSARAYGPW